jgi:O-antigen/teichoic acid export membrane protein
VRDSLKKLWNDSMTYGLGQAVGRGVQLLLVPILTRALTPGEFGVSELVLGYVQAAVVVLVAGMDGALARFFYEQPDRDARVRMVSSSLAFRLITSGIVAALAISLATPIASAFVGGQAYSKYLAIGAATLPFTLLVMFSNDVLRVTFQPLKYVTLNVVQTLIVVAGSIVFVVVMHKGAAGVLYGRLLGDAASAMLGLVLVRHNLTLRFDGALLRRMLSYGAPVVPAAFGFGFIAGLDRYMLQRTRSIEEVAVYAVALRFFSVMTLAASAFQLAYGPFAYAHAAREDSPRLYARVLVAFAALASLGALFVGAFAPEALALLAPRAYAGAALPALFLAFAAVAMGAYTVASVGVGLALKTPWLNVSAGFGVAIALLAHLAFTPRFGPSGAGLSTLLGYFVIALVTFFVAQRVRPMPYRGGLALFLFASALVLAVLAQRLAPWGIPGVVARVAVVAAFALMCVRLRVWTERGAVASASS